MWVLWNRNLTGSRTSTFTSAIRHGWLEELVLGDYKDKKNVSRWEFVTVNLPLDKNYYPNLPWLCKHKQEVFLVAVSKIYVYGTQNFAISYQKSIAEMHQVSSGIKYMVIQDVVHNHHQPSKSPVF